MDITGITFKIKVNTEDKKLAELIKDKIEVIVEVKDLTLEGLNNE